MVPAPDQSSTRGELSHQSTLPALVGLCPDPAHTGEFYMPLDPHEGTTCPQCSEQLVVFVSTTWLVTNGVGSGWLAGRGVAVNG